MVWQNLPLSFHTSDLGVYKKAPSKQATKNFYRKERKRKGYLRFSAAASDNAAATSSTKMME